MEGFLTLKTVFSSVKVYVVLDRQQVTCYDRLKGKNGIKNPKQVRITFSIKNAILSKETKVFTHGIKILTPNKKNIAKFGFGDAKTLAVWYKAFEDATLVHIRENERLQQRQQSWSILNLNPRDKLTKNAITRSYKKLCLVNHPDRGGNIEKFNELYAAYETLIAIHEEEDKKKTLKTIVYEAIVEKDGGDISLGLMVVEDRARERIIVKSVNMNQIRGLSIEAKGNILPNDALIAIDEDDCSNWPLTRIRSRLSRVRVSVGAQIRLTFERRLSPSSNDDNEDKDKDNSNNVAKKETVKKVSNRLNHPNVSVNEESDNSFALTPQDSPVNLSDVRKFFKEESERMAEVTEPFVLGQEDKDINNNNDNDDNDNMMNEPEISFEETHSEDELLSHEHEIFDLSPTVDPNHPSHPSNPNKEEEEEKNNQSDTMKRTEKENILTTTESETLGVEDIRKDMNRYPSLDQKRIDAMIPELQEAISSLQSVITAYAREYDEMKENNQELKERLLEMTYLLDEKYLDVEGGLSTRFLQLNDKLIQVNKEKRLLATALYSKRYIQEKYDVNRLRLSNNKSINHSTGSSKDSTWRVIDSIIERNQIRENRALVLEQRLKDLLSHSIPKTSLVSKSSLPSSRRNSRSNTPIRSPKLLTS